MNYDVVDCEYPTCRTVTEPALRQNESIAESRTYSSSFSRRILQKENAKRISSSVYCYDGDGPVPLWFDENRGIFNKNKMRCIHE